ncbi:Ger(x)C family spore germination protein [Paenibacillus andongensis]|uniref:Ger(x)C family spore germination protein n=1 Tax=Paenibacillus andongensis TaxID=2975482 RepID=UPI0021BB726D|nr:Ger(x)C family spore germination protein [Paenibacillus andongensis]
MKILNDEERNSVMKPFICTGLLLLLFTATGCWDRKEINDLAFVTGSAFDLTDDGKIRGTTQISIPGTSPGAPRGGSEKEKFFVVSAVGKNSSELILGIQNKLSRKLYYAHRSVIIIGESLAKHGIEGVIDHFSRDPLSRLKTYILVAKGVEGRKIFQVHYPFEEASAEAIKEMELLGTGLGVTIRDLYMTSSNEGVNPIMGAIEPSVSSEGMDESKSKLYNLAGSAIFKDFKLVGFLDDKETSGLLWLTNKKKMGRIIADLPEHGGTVGMSISHAERTITSEIYDDHVKFNILLKGGGSLVENNTSLDVSQPKYLKIVEKALEKSLEEQAQACLFKLQKKYKVDSVGFGRHLFRNHFKQWQSIKNQWDRKYPQAEVTISVELTLRGSGMSGAPILLKEKEITK